MRTHELKLLKFLLAYEKRLLVGEELYFYKITPHIGCEGGTFTLTILKAMKTNYLLILLSVWSLRLTAQTTVPEELFVITLLEMLPLYLDTLIPPPAIGA